MELPRNAKRFQLATFVLVPLYAALPLVFGFQMQVLAQPLAPREPEQLPLRGETKPFVFKDRIIEPQYAYRIEALLLSRKRYRFDAVADLSPLDFALGWGDMSDRTTLQSIHVSQGGRWYRWSSRDVPISSQAISRQSANVHVIPATKDLANRLKKAKEGQVIRLVGNLVNVKQHGEIVWTSSTTRNDTGSKSCEVLWVEKFQIIRPNRD